MNHRANRLLDQVDDLADRRRQRGTGNEHLARPDDCRVLGFVEERPHESGLIQWGLKRAGRTRNQSGLSIGVIGCPTPALGA